jgi:hypothetical protein
MFIWVLRNCKAYFFVYALALRVVLRDFCD